MIMFDNTKVTLELRELIESGVKVWDFDYPSFYEGEEKKAFEQKVIDHYYFRQIGQETPARWLHYFRTRIREIMPYYIDLYHSVELFKSIEDPLESYNLVETFKETGTDTGFNSGQSKTDASGTTSSGSSETGTSGTVRKHSDTPQGSINNIETYMSDATKEDGNTSHEVEGSETSESSGTTVHTVNTTDERERSYELTRRGNIGVQPLGDEIKKLREAYINIDMMIINELNDLFLMVY